MFSLVHQRMGLFFYTAEPVSPAEATLQAQRCVGENNQSYVCESGYCCGGLQCCSNFYELWWIWLLCALIFILTCYCVCRHWRSKHRQQQQQRQREINLIAYREARNYTSPPFYFRFLPSYLLPDYEDVTNRPLTPPPPYCNLSAGPPACTDNDQQEAQCSSREATPVLTASTALCSSPDPMGLENSRKNQHRDDERDRETVLKRDMACEDQVRDEDVPEEEKDGLMGRRRHFTGDSGIDVCLCSQGTESHRTKELEELLSNEVDGGSMEFCDDCGAKDDKDSE